MAPIRVGIIGLSTSSTSDWASRAHLPALLAAKDRYTIAAVCNTSIASAERAIANYKLTPSTKAYGNARDLADDPDVDLVVCSTRVDTHYETTAPSILAGKDVFVEWPLAENLERASELAKMAEHKGVKTMIGLQGQKMPITTTVKALIEDGKIGKMISSTIFASGAVSRRDALPPGLKYFTEKRVGGNPVTIGYAHMIDFVHTALGEFVSMQANLHFTRPYVQITNQDGAVLETVKSELPDLVIVHGTIAKSGAPLSVTFRRGPPFPGSKAFDWAIQGEKGEIRVTGPGPTLPAWDDNSKIEVHDFATDEVKVVDWDHGEFQALPGPARSVARMYDLFAQGYDKSYPTFEGAVVRHRELEALLDRSEEGLKVSYV